MLTRLSPTSLGPRYVSSWRPAKTKKDTKSFAGQLGHQHSLPGGDPRGAFKDHDFFDHHDGVDHQNHDDADHHRIILKIYLQTMAKVVAAMQQLENGLGSWRSCGYDFDCMMRILATLCQCKVASR